jgi:hypothetical protein
MSSLGVKNMSFAYANITNQAMYYYPDFATHQKNKYDEDRNNWSKILQQAVKSGEVADTIDIQIVANLFHNVYVGVKTCGIILAEEIAPIETHRALICIYNLIKK